MLNELVEGAKRNPIWFGSIGAIAGVQAWLGWEFWGALSTDPAEQVGLRAVGMAFVGAEVVALDMASRHALNNEKTRASVLRAMWASLALLNLGVDVGSFSRVMDASDETRAALVRAEAAREAERSDLALRIDRADDPFDNRLLSVSAYDLALASKDREMELAQRAPRWRQRQIEAERGELQVRRETAQQIAEWQARIDALNSLSRAAPPTPEIGAQFTALAETLTGVQHGVQGVFGQRPQGDVSPEEARNGVSAFAVAVMKALLTAGLWLGLDRRVRQATPLPLPCPAESPAAPPALPEPTHRPALPGPRRAPQTVKRFTRNGAR